jgi:hypothetical protein
MIGWAIHRENTLARWIREQVAAVLPVPNRKRANRSERKPAMPAGQETPVP